jgi:hypothetical protein
MFQRSSNLVADKLRIAVVDPIFRTGVVQALRRDKNVVVAEGGC